MSMKTNHIISYIAAVTAAACVLTATACTSRGEPEPWEFNFDLPNEQAVLSRIDEIYGSREKAYLLGNTVQRMPCPEAGATYSFDFKYELDEYRKIIIEDAVVEINEVFEVVNPHYKFEVNYAPTDADLKDKYSIAMNKVESFASPTTLGQAHMSTGSFMSNFGITLKTTALNDLRYLMLTFRHEFMHILGAGDAYNNAKAEKNTVMQNYNNTTYRHFSSSDVAFIDAYYRNPENRYTDAEIKTYINNYESATTHTFDNALADLYASAADNVDPKALEAAITAKGYADPSKLVGLVKNGINRDTNFGQSAVSMTELEYTAPPQTAYYGGFDPETGKYEHGTSKGTMSFSQTINYKDYKNGLLYAAPNGNMYTVFVKTGDYVLLFDLDGGYYDLDELGLTFRIACSVNA